MFIALTKTSVKNSEIFLEAAQAKIQLKAPATEIKVLLDSAVNEAKNSGTMAGPYYLARGDFQAEQGEYRSAIADYNMYDSIVRPVNPAFLCFISLCIIDSALLASAHDGNEYSATTVTVFPADFDMLFILLSVLLLTPILHAPSISATYTLAGLNP